MKVKTKVVFVLSRLRRAPRDTAKFPAVRIAVALRVIGLILFGGALPLLAYESGNTTKSKTPWVESFLTTVTKPAVSIPLASLLVIGIAAFFRRLRFEYLVWKPGAIAVRDLEAPASISDVGDIAQLSTKFRQRLMTMRLQAPTPVPGATPAEDFLAMLDAEKLDPKNPLATAVSLLRASVPTHGFEVSARLVQEPAAGGGRPRCGVTAQVARLPHEAIPVDTAWASSWPDAVTEAADMVTAAILSRTRLSNRPPWAGWRRYAMPARLVHHFERAEERTSERRYDEALSLYFGALESDPKNVDLRLHKAFVEEKLGLCVDAVATYVSARKIAADTARRLYHLRARASRRASGKVARYRLSVLLSGRKFAHQWRKPKSPSMRDQQRVFLRRRLMPELEDLLTAHKLVEEGNKRRIDAGAEPPWDAEYVRALLEEFRTAVSDDLDSRYYELRHVFGWLAKKELAELRRSLRVRPVADSGLSQTSVRLTIDALELRLEYIARRLGQMPTWPVDEKGNHIRPPAGSNPWRVKPEQWVPREEKFQRWSEQYNAACLYALPLLIDDEWLDSPQERDEERRHELAASAVAFLKAAMSTTVSWYAAQRRDWLLSEDPDLAGLRRRPEFKTFEAVYFPSASRTPKRPRGVHRWEHSCYTNALLSESAKRWEKIWHDRREAVATRVDPHAVIEWSRDEADAWELVEKLTTDYRHWRVRYDLIERMNQWSDKYGFEPLKVGVPSYVGRFDSEGEEVTDDIDGAIKANCERLESLLYALGAMSGKPNGNGNGENGSGNGHAANSKRRRPQRLVGLERRHLERLQNELRNRDFWHRAPPRLYLPVVCDVHAALWQRLHEWIDAPAQHTDKAEKHFNAAISQAAHLSATFNGVWMLALLDRRLRLLPKALPPAPHSSSNGQQEVPSGEPAAPAL